MTGRTDTWVSVRPHQSRICWVSTARPAVSQRPTGSEPVTASRERWMTKVMCLIGVGAGWSCSSARAEAGSASTPTARRAAYVEGVDVAAVLLVGVGEGGGDPGQGLVEVVEVLPVTAQGHVDHARVVDGLGVEGGVAVVEGRELGQLTLLGVQPQHGFVEQPLEHGGTDGGGDRGELGVEVGAHVVGRVEHGLRDPAGAPRLEIAGADPTPDRGQPVA